MGRTMSPVHPGETLREDFLAPLGLTANGLAMELPVPATRISDIVHCTNPLRGNLVVTTGRPTPVRNPVSQSVAALVGEISGIVADHEQHHTD